MERGTAIQLLIVWVVSKNTYSYQVSGTEEPVDLGWFCE